MKNRVLVVLDVEFNSEKNMKPREMQDFVAERISIKDELNQKSGLIKYVSSEINGELIGADKDSVELLEKIYKNN